MPVNLLTSTLLIPGAGVGVLKLHAGKHRVIKTRMGRKMRFFLKLDMGSPPGEQFSY